ncbi:outer membrane beta-barrel protein [Shewanella algae]|uniref:outer membrane beta-barrel protein n=1 Tax=Shewanella algae TaxID=38313 RepID=UPI001AAD0009|nr:outer membrane beta-barrel protein [Shewanella algae]MBO2656591.1 porin family protein [Shewanella algae]
MKIQSLVLASAAALAFSAPSFAADWFVGGGVGAQQNDYSHKPTDGGKFSDDDRNAFYMLRGGAFLTPNQRLYATYSYNSDDFAKQQMGLVSYDYLIGLDQANKLNWFVGASAGINHTAPDSGALESDNNFVWGGQTGLVYKLSDNLNTEIGYRYLKQDYDNKIDSGKYALDNTQQLYLSVDYRF